MKKLFSLVLASLMAFSLVACGGSDTEEKTDGAKLTLATSADFPPYEYIADDGSFAGIDIEVAGAIAEKLGMELEVINMDFNSIVTSVSTGKFDIGMAGLTVTPDRLESVDFTDSYATGIQAIIVKEDSPIKTVDDLYAEGVAYKVGAQITTTGAIYMAGDIEDGKTSCTLNEFKSGADAIMALQTGKIDCVIIDKAPATSFVEANEGLKILETEYTVEDYAICVQKGNTELKDKINVALAELIEDGTVGKIVEKYIPSK